MCIGVVGIIVTTVTAGGDMDIAIAAGGNFKKCGVQMTAPHFLRYAAVAPIPRHTRSP
jgi:hypothetical protein